MEFLKKVTEARHVSGVSLNGGLVERPLCKAVKLKPGLPWRHQLLEMPELWDTC